MSEVIEEFSRLLPDLEGESELLSNRLADDLPGSALAFLTVAIEKKRRLRSSADSKHSSPLLVVAESNQEAELLAAEATFIGGRDVAAFLPGFDGIPYEYARFPTFISRQRVKVLGAILKNEARIIFTTPSALLQKLPPPSTILERITALSVEQCIEPRDLAAALIHDGYERTERVENPGEFCLKGGLLDVFPVNSERPLRIDFFDDIIETIRTFDPETQIAEDKLKSCEIFPASEIILDEKESRTLLELMGGEEYGAELIRPPWHSELESSHENSGDELVLYENGYPGLRELFALIQKPVTLLSYFSQPPLILVNSRISFEERITKIISDYEALYSKEKERHICLEPAELLNLKLSEELEQNRQVRYLNQGGVRERLPEFAEEKSAPETAVEKPSAVLAEGALIRPVDRFRGRITESRERITEMVKSGNRVVITSPYSSQLKRIAEMFPVDVEITLKELPELEDFSALKDEPATLWLCRSDLRQGFQLPQLNFFIWTDSDIFGRSYRRRAKFKKVASKPIDSFVDLKLNDYVVHVNHGVGKFKQIEKVKAAGRERDFIVLEYADNDRLYVPLDQLSLVQKYVAPVEEPRLDSLGKSSFKKVKERVEKRIEELAQDLINIYAVRQSQKGYAFPPDTVWQEEFEGSFPYDETPDQLRAIEAVKNDMETDRPMDRLICGDVGYGKTEVAIRACFKSVMAGKQAIIIAPTTVLALQHFNNFKSRLENFPIKVDWISRFRSRTEIREVKENLKDGEIDVIIGTHALLADDIRYKNPGLLIVDEEQRFGVSHKEAIKKMKKMIDVLTLSATPIPRTLHMSLVGIRDLSIIETPPRDRLPVQTYVIEESENLVKEAITRELAREGQVFYLHNRVETIDATASRLRQLLPGVRLATLHGQLPEEEIEEVLFEFLHRNYDVLITTTIIENGIDMPNVNTLLVDRADTFGLSQLYQIRGRVGRSGRQAFAYLFYPPDRSLNEKASRRLNTIQEYQELGSGFKVAMRDLEIRGAGNVLGKEQSGDIIDVGFELYVKLLDEAVKRLQGVDSELEVRCSLKLMCDYYLGEEYISDTRQRIEFYKRYEAATELRDVENLGDEMFNRFGRPPTAAENFLMMEKIRVLAGQMGLENINEEEPGVYKFQSGENFKIPIEHIIRQLSNTSELSLIPGRGNQLKCELSGSESERLEYLFYILQGLAAPLLEEQNDAGGES